MKTATCLLALLTLGVLARGHVIENFSQTYPLAPDGVIRLENVNGSVEITAWDKAEVRLEAEKAAPDEEQLKRIHLEIDATASRLSVKTRYEKKSTFFNTDRGEVHYRLKVPAGASLENIDVVNCSVTVRGVRGRAELNSVNGRIEGSGFAGAGRFETVNGSIAVAYDALPPSGSVALKSVNGSCHLTVARDAGFELRADSVNGSIRCDLPVTLEKSGGHHLRGRVGSGGCEVILDSVNGGLAITAK